MENPTKMDDLGVPLFEEGLKKNVDNPSRFPWYSHDIPINYQYPHYITINIPINYQYPH